MKSKDLPDMQSVTACGKCGGDRNAPGHPGTRFKIEYVKKANDEYLILTCPVCGAEYDTKTFENSADDTPGDAPDLIVGCKKCKGQFANANCGSCGRDMRK